MAGTLTRAAVVELWPPEAGHGRPGWALVYVLVSVVAGLLAVAAGRGLA